MSLRIDCRALIFFFGQFDPSGPISNARSDVRTPNVACRVFCTPLSAKISDCTHAVGGAFCVDGGAVSLTGTTISTATAGTGGCMYVGTEGTVNATDSLFEGCVAEVSDEGIWIIRNYTQTIIAFNGKKRKMAESCEKVPEVLSRKVVERYKKLLKITGSYWILRKALKVSWQKKTYETLHQESYFFQKILIAYRWSHLLLSHP